MAEVTLQKVAKSYGDVDVLSNIDLSIADGEFCVFVGPSGCGKSTLLRMIAGLEDISSGTLTIGGRVVNRLSPKERGIAMVFQSYALYPHRTVRGNMEFGLKLSRMSAEERAERIARASRMLQIEHLLDRRPSQLSGGQRQRVAIGRAIVRDPSVFLFDEPLSNLDAALRVSTRREIADLHRKLGTTMIYVTHDQVEAMTLADRIVVLNEKSVQQVGTPMELYHRPGNIFVARFIGSPKMNIFQAVVKGSDGKSLSLEIEGLGTLVVPGNRRDVSEGAPVFVGLRPEHITLEPAGSGFTGQVAAVEQLGDETLVELRPAVGEPIMVKAGASDMPRYGEEVAFRVDSSAVHLFDKDGLAIQQPFRDPGSSAF